MVPPVGANNLLVVGAGGLAREIAWALEEGGHPWRFSGFLADQEWADRRSPPEGQVVGGIRDWVKFSDAAFIVAIAAPRIRRAVIDIMETLGQVPYATVIHPSVKLSSRVTLGAGTFVAAGCVLTTQVAVGRHVIIDRGSQIGHDCRVHDFSTLAPMTCLSGNVVAGAGSQIGAAAVVRQGISLGKGSMVGMGAVVVKDVADNSLVMGNPARAAKNLDPF